MLDRSFEQELMGLSDCVEFRTETCTSFAAHETLPSIARAAPGIWRGVCKAAHYDADDDDDDGRRIFK